MLSIHPADSPYPSPPCSVPWGADPHGLDEWVPLSSAKGRINEGGEGRRSARWTIFFHVELKHGLNHFS